MSETDSLEAELGKMRAAAAERTPPEYRERVRLVTEELERTVALGALAVGERAPAFTLQTPEGASVRLSDELAHGPVVLSFYRGHW